MCHRAIQRKAVMDLVMFYLPIISSLKTTYEDVATSAIVCVTVVVLALLILLSADKV
jgi:hypothetical protein